MGPISAKHGWILLKFLSFERLGQKLQQDPCASRLRDLAAFFIEQNAVKMQQKRTTPNQRKRLRVNQKLDLLNSVCCAAKPHVFRCSESPRYVTCELR